MNGFEARKVDSIMRMCRTDDEVKAAQDSLLASVVYGKGSPKKTKTTTKTHANKPPKLMTPITKTDGVLYELKLRELETKCRKHAVASLRRFMRRHYLQWAFSALRVPLGKRLARLEERIDEEGKERAEIEGRVMGTVLSGSAGSVIEDRLAKLEERMNRERMLGDRGSGTSVGQTALGRLPQDPASVFKSLSNSMDDAEDDDVVVVVEYEEEEEEDESDEDEEKFAELPSTLPCRSPHPPYSPEFYINSHTAADFNNFESKLDEFASDDVYARRMAWEQEFKRRLNKISDRVDRLLESSAKER